MTQRREIITRPIDRKICEAERYEDAARSADDPERRAAALGAACTIRREARQLEQEAANA